MITDALKQKKKNSLSRKDAHVQKETNKKSKVGKNVASDPLVRLQGLQRCLAFNEWIKKKKKVNIILEVLRFHSFFFFYLSMKDNVQTRNSKSKMRDNAIKRRNNTNSAREKKKKQRRNKP